MKKTIISFLGLALVIAGCTYSLRITNLLDFVPSHTQLPRTVKIGFVGTNDPLLNSVMDEISFHPQVEVTKKYYQIGTKIETDYICELLERKKFRASGKNFIITFPGFIVFAHAWSGYKYFIDIETNVRIIDPNGNILKEFSIVTPYTIRYTSIDRGVISTVGGWLMPAFGLLNIIPATIFAFDYDERATDEFIEKVLPSYKVFVSSKILEQIAEIQRMTPVSASRHIFNMQPVVIDVSVVK